MAEEFGGSAQDRTEPATPKKREDSRQKGSVARSLEVNSALILLAGLLLLSSGGAAMASALAGMSAAIFAGAASVQLTRATVVEYAASGMFFIARVAGPLMFGLMIIGLAASASQVGFLFSVEALKPKWTKINPLSGIARVFFSRRSAVEMVKSLVKVAIVGLVAYAAIDGMLADAVTLLDGDVSGILSFIASGSLSVAAKAGLAFIVLAVLDYLFQRFEHERDLRMTKQEVKEESKMLEGDPLIKSRIRSVQRQIAYKRMMHDVPKSDVVVTNPTHVAVALKYEIGSSGAPKVVAKGAELIAKRIREIATEHGVPIVEDRPLARALYKSVKIGQEIPEKLFHAVAQLLAMIYRMKAKGGTQ